MFTVVRLRCKQNWMERASNVSWNGWVAHDPKHIRQRNSPSAAAARTAWIRGGGHGEMKRPGAPLQGGARPDRL
jgi:hypothetical protein